MLHHPKPGGPPSAAVRLIAKRLAAARLSDDDRASEIDLVNIDTLLKISSLCSGFHSKN